jgi:hypothetical protein
MNKHGKPRRLSAPLTPAVAAKQHHLKNNDCSPRLQKTSILGLIQNFSHGSLRFRPRAARAFTTLFFGIYGQCSILEFGGFDYLLRRTDIDQRGTDAG